MKRLNLSVIIYLCLVFLSGALLGWIGYGLYNSRSVDAARKANPCTADAVRHRYIEEMRTRLKLRAPQVEKLTAILEETHQRFKILREKWKPEVKLLQEEQANEIRAMLDNVQRAEYEKVRQEREKADQQQQKKP
jgi:hypothetical protein